MAQPRSFSSLRLEAHLISSQGAACHPSEKESAKCRVNLSCSRVWTKKLSTYRCGSKEFSNLIDFFVVSRSNYTDSTGRSNTRPHLRTFLFYRLVVQSGPAESIVKMMSKSQGSTWTKKKRSAVCQCKIHWCKNNRRGLTDSLQDQREHFPYPSSHWT